MKLIIDITSEQAREIIQSLQSQLANQEVLLDGHKPLEVLAMPPTALVIECDNKGLRTRARSILERVQTGNPLSWQEEGVKPVTTLEAFCRLEEEKFRMYGWANGKAGKLVKAALARKGLKLFMSRADIQAYKEGTFKLSFRDRARI